MLDPEQKDRGFGKRLCPTMLRGRFIYLHDTVIYVTIKSSKWISTKLDMREGTYK